MFGVSEDHFKCVRVVLKVSYPISQIFLDSENYHRHSFLLREKFCIDVKVFLGSLARTGDLDSLGPGGSKLCCSQSSLYAIGSNTF